MDLASSAKIIKARFVDYIIHNNFFTDNFCIGQEIMYGTNRLVADMVIISESKLYAIEIKSARDDLRRIDNQLLNYNKIFDYVYVITTDKYQAHIKNADDKIGIFTFSDNGDFQLTKKASLLKSFNKEEALNTIPISFLKKYYQLKSSLLAHEVRANLCAKSKKSIKECLNLYLTNCISYKYANFISEKGEQSHFEDIAILSFRDYYVLK
jgi:hypothetical protein